MTRSIDQIVAEFDEVFEKNASAKVKEPRELVSDEIMKLASELTCPTEEELEIPVEGTDLTLLEKVAHSLAITEILVNLPQLKKVAHFQEKAEEQGHPSEEIAKYAEKAVASSYTPISEIVPWLAGA